MGEGTPAVVPARRGAIVGAVVAVALVALTVRIAVFVAPDALLWMRENDDGIMFAGSVALLHGRLPYVDFDFVHPPGSLLALTPFALLGGGTTEAVGLAGARLFTVGVGVANATIIALLLRRFGVAAILVGGGLYAVWGAAVATEQTYLLEPYLNLALLVALLAVASRHRSAPIVAGIALGLALVTKYWAIIDVALVAWMVVAMLGRRAVARYLVSGAISAGVAALPFFFTDPVAMWSLTVSAQLGRGGNDVPLVERADVFSPYVSFEALRELIPTAASGLGMALLLAFAALPAVEMLRARRPPSTWPDEAWWVIIALAHALVLAVSAMFFYHYAAWLMAPLALSLGAAVGRLRHVVVRRAVLALSLVVLAVMAAGELVPAETTPSARVLQAWAADRSCVAGMTSTLVAADRVATNLDNDCPMDIDPLSLGMTLPNAASLSHRDLVESEAWHARWWSYVEGADAAVMLPSERAWLSEDRLAHFERQFVLDDRIGPYELWIRQGR